MLPNFQCVLSGNQYGLSSYLVDEVYLQWAISIIAVAMTGTEKEKSFSGLQEEVRRDAMCAFGVFVSHSHVVLKLCLFQKRK